MIRLLYVVSVITSVMVVFALSALYHKKQKETMLRAMFESDSTTFSITTTCHSTFLQQLNSIDTNHSSANEKAFVARVKKIRPNALPHFIIDCSRVLYVRRYSYAEKNDTSELTLHLGITKKISVTLQYVRLSNTAYLFTHLKGMNNLVNRMMQLNAYGKKENLR